MSTNIGSLTQMERDAILAGLRMLATRMSGRDGAPALIESDGSGIGDILTGSGTHDGLTEEQVWDLGDRWANS
jgi:hypothetical protein